MKPTDELKFCLELWGKQGYCNFGGKTECEKCGTPYLLYKMATGKVLHDSEMKRLTLSDWKKLVENIL
ncbi:MAG: hypothetical protein WC511_07010 [Candidatus Pacearchaeota archaeon]|jgi:hypothetical protein